MHATPGALVVGEALIDLVATRADASGRGVPAALVREHVGGSPCNVATGLARLGRDVEYLGDVGADGRGRRIVAHLEQAGVRVAPESVGDGATSTATATIAADGSASYEFAVRWNPRPGAHRPRRLVHTGSIAAVLEPGANTVAGLLDRHRVDATISLDPNVRPAFLPEDGRGAERIESLVARADVVKASDEDLAVLHPGSDPRDIARAWLARGPSVVAVTLGADGSFAVCRAGVVELPARPATVVDTVGAGDSFMVGLLDRLWEDSLLGAGRRRELAAIPLSGLRAALDRAALAAALTVARPGADLPTRAMLDDAQGRSTPPQ